MIAALAAFLFVASPAAALPARLPPVDQCRGDASFVKFRDRLKQVVAKRDRDRLLASLAPDALISFDGSTGRDEFAKKWSFDPTEYGNVWDQLETMLKLGCSNSDGTPMIPSLLDQLDPYGTSADIDMRLALPGARLFKEPGREATAEPVAAWSLVTATDGASDLWTGVRLADGREGFIPDDKVYEPFSYRMTFKKVHGRWMITAFIDGE